MGRKRQEWRIEVVGEPPAELSPEAIHFFADWMADLHIARLEAERIAPPGPDAVTVAGKPPLPRAEAAVLAVARVSIVASEPE